MAIYGSFLGQGDGYTGAQRTGLRRSAEIKKRRKEEERAFEKTQEREKGARALAERGMIEAGATRRTAMGEAGATERERMSNIGMMARQRLIGEQGVRAAKAKRIGAADIASMEYGRGLTMAEKGHERAMELAKVKGKDSPEGLFEDSSAVTEKPGLGRKETPKSVLTSFLDMDDSAKKAYMDRLKKEDPDTYLSLAKQFKAWSAPKEELPEEETYADLGGRSIYQSKSGTYRNF